MDPDRVTPTAVAVLVLVASVVVTAWGAVAGIALATLAALVLYVGHRALAQRSRRATS